MQYRFIVDKEKTITALAVSIFCLVVAAILLPLGRTGSVVVFFSIGLLFTVVAAVNGAVIRLDQNGITKTILGIPLHHVDWSQVKEVGVCGTNPLNKGQTKKTGRLCIYCSVEALDDDARYAMILNWPPKQTKQLYFAFSRERLEALRLLWRGEMEEYNIGDLLL